jgi:hypothetical protein
MNLAAEFDQAASPGNSSGPAPAPGAGPGVSVGVQLGRRETLVRMFREYAQKQNIIVTAEDCESCVDLCRDQIHLNRRRMAPCQALSELTTDNSQINCSSDSDECQHGESMSLDQEEEEEEGEEEEEENGDMHSDVEVDEELEVDPGMADPGYASDADVEPEEEIDVNCGNVDLSIVHEDIGTPGWNGDEDSCDIVFAKTPAKRQRRRRAALLDSDSDSDSDADSDADRKDDDAVVDDSESEAEYQFMYQYASDENSDDDDDNYIEEACDDSGNDDELWSPSNQCTIDSVDAEAEHNNGSSLESPINLVDEPMMMIKRTPGPRKFMLLSDSDESDEESDVSHGSEKDFVVMPSACEIRGGANDGAKSCLQGKLCCVCKMPLY